MLRGQGTVLNITSVFCLCAEPTELSILIGLHHGLKKGPRRGTHFGRAGWEPEKDRLEIDIGGRMKEPGRRGESIGRAG